MTLLAAATDDGGGGDERMSVCLQEKTPKKKKPVVKVIDLSVTACVPQLNPVDLNLHVEKEVGGGGWVERGGGGGRDGAGGYLYQSISSISGGGGQGGLHWKNILVPKLLFGVKHHPQNGGRFLVKNLVFGGKNVFPKLKQV